MWCCCSKEVVDVIIPQALDASSTRCNGSVVAPPSQPVLEKQTSDVHPASAIEAQELSAVSVAPLPAENPTAAAEAAALPQLPLTAQLSVRNSHASTLHHELLSTVFPSQCNSRSPSVRIKEVEEFSDSDSSSSSSACGSVEDVKSTSRLAGRQERQLQQERRLQQKREAEAAAALTRKSQGTLDLATPATGGLGGTPLLRSRSGRLPLARGVSYKLPAHQAEYPTLTTTTSKTLDLSSQPSIRRLDSGRRVSQAGGGLLSARSSHAGGVPDSSDSSQALLPGQGAAALGARSRPLSAAQQLLLGLPGGPQAWGSEGGPGIKPTRSNRFIPVLSAAGVSAGAGSSAAGQAGGVAAEGYGLGLMRPSLPLSSPGSALPPPPPPSIFARGSVERGSGLRRTVLFQAPPPPAGTPPLALTSLAATHSQAAPGLTHNPVQGGYDQPLPTPYPGPAAAGPGGVEADAGDVGGPGRGVLQAGEMPAADNPIDLWLREKIRSARIQGSGLEEGVLPATSSTHHQDLLRRASVPASLPPPPPPQQQQQPPRGQTTTVQLLPFGTAFSAMPGSIHGPSAGAGPGAGGLSPTPISDLTLLPFPALPTQISRVATPTLQPAQADRTGLGQGQWQAQTQALLQAQLQEVFSAPDRAPGMSAQQLPANSQAERQAQLVAQAQLQVAQSPLSFLVHAFQEQVGASHDGPTSSPRAANDRPPLAATPSHQGRWGVEAAGAPRAQTRLTAARLSHNGDSRVRLGFGGVTPGVTGGGGQCVTGPSSGGGGPAGRTQGHRPIWEVSGGPRSTPLNKHASVPLEASQQQQAAGGGGGGGLALAASAPGSSQLCQCPDSSKEVGVGGYPLPSLPPSKRSPNLAAAPQRAVSQLGPKTPTHPQQQGGRAAPAFAPLLSSPYLGPTQQVGEVLMPCSPLDQLQHQWQQAQAARQHGLDDGEGPEPLAAGTDLGWGREVVLPGQRDSQVSSGPCASDTDSVERSSLFRRLGLAEPAKPGAPQPAWRPPIVAAAPAPALWGRPPAAAAAAAPPLAAHRSVPLAIGGLAQARPGAGGEPGAGLGQTGPMGSLSRGFQVTLPSGGLALMGGMGVYPFAQRQAA
ncbi:hypothetical protein V8C86DRAFT_1490307 [Haematococcus lacustris]